MRLVTYFIIVMVFLFAWSACQRPEVGAENETPAPGQRYQARESKMVFHPVVAGAFYTDNPTKLKRQVEKFIDEADVPADLGEVFGVVSPHAGYVYSGAVAGHSFKAVKDKKYDVVVIMGPSHRVPITVSVLDYQSYRTPLGDVKIDVEASQRLAESASFIDNDDSMFRMEHSLEVQLPFVQVALPNAKVVMVGIGTTSRKVMQQLAQALNQVFAGRKVLFVASTDMSHFRNYESAKKIDLETLDFLGRGDLDDLFATRDYRERMCGIGPVTALYELYKLRGGSDFRVLKYLNSGDTAGDRNRVVGYGSVALVGKNMEENSANTDDDLPAAQATGDEDPLSADDKKMLLNIARTTLDSYLKTGKRPVFDISSPVLLDQGAAFVTLRKGPNKQLRGCIGHIIATMPLWECVREMAVAAATQDPRFPKVRHGELAEINIEISVLTPPVPVEDVSEIRVGVHGLIMSHGFRRGLLLPQVPVELAWDRDTFLDQTCVKAGMRPGCWRDDDTRIERFSAVVFSE